MKILLDKEDTQAVFKNFVDIATREYINQKIAQLFEERIESIIKRKLETLNLETMFDNKINRMVRDHFKIGWNGRCENVNLLIEKKIDKIDVKKIVTEKFTKKVMEEVFGRLMLRE